MARIRRSAQPIEGPRAYAVDDVELARLQERELVHWRENPHERPESDSIFTIINKFGDAIILFDLLRRYGPVFERAGSMLELGAGQGWASCIVKHLFPNARVTVTDISADALAGVPKWERIFGVQVDEVRACRSYEIGAPDGSVDLIFCFASAHHFVAHRRTLAEISRVLAPGGDALYLFEVACRPFAHRWAKRRLNKMRPAVPEDVLVYDNIAALARGLGLDCTVDFYPTLLRRRPLETIYYATLRAIPPLQRLLPCTINLRFSKPTRTAPLEES